MLVCNQTIQFSEAESFSVSSRLWCTHSLNSMRPIRLHLLPRIWQALRLDPIVVTGMSCQYTWSTKRKHIFEINVPICLICGAIPGNGWYSGTNVQWHETVTRCPRMPSRIILVQSESHGIHVSCLHHAYHNISTRTSDSDCKPVKARKTTHYFVFLHYGTIGVIITSVSAASKFFQNRNESCFR